MKRSQFRITDKQRAEADDLFARISDRIAAVRKKHLVSDEELKAALGIESDTTLRRLAAHPGDIKLERWHYLAPLLDYDNKISRRTRH